MLGYRFLVPGAFYQVITHRLDTAHFDHWYPTGTIVKCVDVTPAHEGRTVLGCRDFTHPTLTGLFIDSNGVDQVLATGDVRRCR
ncbi:hypothetical protein CHOED_049 [Vibrio phage CHOED]|uniref:hypothetical protein n=1 Tax=Vibrio phage CHOED TaxID=1458716 RepID=UPI00042EC58C|nr:hypothetical protein CHOED_049 [Vibrio phage CHOED]AHK11909.1 hypothetical protein CHOED_049 [Vibrio phage CHOED]